MQLALNARNIPATWAGMRYRPWMLAVVAVPVVLQVALVTWISRSMLGRDYGLYMDATRRWLDGGSFYLPAQLAGPYDMPWGQILYPPQALALFVPFTVLPAVLFVLIPLAITVGMIASWRPSRWFYVFLVAYLWWNPYAILIYLAGNPSVWLVAIVALSMRWRWVSAFALFKPSAFLIPLIGIRDPRWWIVAGIVLQIAVAYAQMSLDWVHVVLNARGPNSGLLYSLGDYLACSIPVAAYLTRFTWARGRPSAR